MQDNMQDVPRILVGNDEIKNRPSITDGELIYCKRCGGEHKAEFGTSKGQKTNLLICMRCDKTGRVYLIGVDGKLLPGEGE